MFSCLVYEPKPCCLCFMLWLHGTCSASGNETVEVRLEMLESKNNFPVYAQELSWGKWEMEKPCVELSPLAYLEFRLLHSSAHMRS